MVYFFDTYALIELIRGNLNYKPFSSAEIVTSKLTLMELYGYMLREYGIERAEFFFDKFLLNCEDVPDTVLKRGVSFRAKINRELKRRKKPLSYIDAISYVFAQHLGVKFLTGDETFRGLENVEFVK